MRIYTSVNPLLEAVCYYNRRVNGSTISDVVLKLEKHYPDKRPLMLPFLSQILELEASLNEVLRPDPERLDFFFRRMDGVPYEDTTDRLPASILLLECFHRNLDTLEKAQDYVARKSISQIRVEICNILSEDENVPWTTADGDALMDFLETLPYPDATRWRILDLSRHFRQYLAELLELLRPAVEQIQQRIIQFQNLAAFYSQALADEETMATHVRALLGVNTKEYRHVELHVSVMNFNSATVILPESPRKHLRIYMGALMHLLRAEAATIDFTKIARAMKTLGDPSRLELFCFIRNQALYGQDMADRMNLTSTTVYHHMNKLILEGLVESQFNGTKAYFSMRRDKVEELLGQLRALLLG